MTKLYWDPIDPTLRDDPYPLWKRLRDEAPAYYNDRYDFWALSRFADVEAAHKDTVTYSNAHTTTLEMMTPEPVDTGIILWLDPPKHSLLRRLVSRAFTTRRVSGLEDHIRQISIALLDSQVGSGTFDYVQDFAAILPPTVISSLLGVPEADQERLRGVVDEMFHVEEGLGMMNEVSENARRELNDYLLDQFNDRRRKPRDDMLTDLVEAEISGNGQTRRLTNGELQDFGTVLFSAGTETVARHLGWVVDVLEANPEQRAELAGDLSLVPNAIEEILRLEPPSPINARWLTKEIELHGHTIPKDTKVILLTGAAGRDERKYTDPDTLDIHRRIDLHLTFGHGIHYCLGAALARMEGRIGLEETLKRWPEWTIDRDNSALLYTSTVRGYRKLPMQAGPRATEGRDIPL